MTSIEQRRQVPIVCPGHTRPLAELQFCAIDTEEEKRNFLISACHDKMPMLRDGSTGDWHGTFMGHNGAVWSAKLDPMGYLAATASGDFSVRVWDAITGQNLCQFPHKHIVKTVDFSPDSKFLATGGHEGLLRIYDLVECTKSQNKKAIKPIHEFRVEESDGKKSKYIITKCLWYGNDKVLASGSDGTVRVWDIERGSTTIAFSVDGDSEVRDMELKETQDGNNILISAAGGKVCLFNLKTNEVLSRFDMPIHFRDEGGASLHPNGTKFIAGGSDLWVRVFDSASGDELSCLKGHHGPIRCLRYSPDGGSFASGSEDGTIRLWKSDIQ